MTSPRFEVLDWVETPLGPLCLRRRELLGRPGALVTEVTLDHELLMSSLNTVSEEAQATRALAQHPGRGLRVLVGGLGLGYTAAAALASDRVARVRVIELLPAVAGWLRDGLIPLADRLNADPRLEVVLGDVYGLLLGPPAETWDLVLVDVDHAPDEPLGPASAAFYGDDGLARAARHLRPGGLLSLWSAGGDDPALAAALARTFDDVRVERVAWTNELIDEGVEVEDVLFVARRREDRDAAPG